MPSFDVVSNYQKHEVENAVDQARKEIVGRYDFRGTNTSLERAGEDIVIRTNSEEKCKAALEVLYARLSKRGVSLTFLDEQKVEGVGNQQVRQLIKLKQGIAQEKAKEIQALIRDSKLKVQASIQGDAVRVAGKQKDELQAAMNLLRGQQEQLSLVLQFNNFRD
ncbi:MAG: YajQ family cyclic di-GMP-binding protein [Deltaproteobacteria bacterium]|nr:YajQ family cyclic di-GMP-binding protein [Deltaproteobacteria bacterium]